MQRFGCAHACARKFSSRSFRSSAGAWLVDIVGIAGYKPNRGNAHTLLKQNQGISKRVEEIQAEQLAMHQQATAEAAANAKVTLESLIAEAEAARVKQCPRKVGPPQP
jgi:hypothetical protein